MNSILLGIAGTLIGPISGLVTFRLMNWIDDVAKLTEKWPDTLKQLLVMALAAVVPVANSQWGVELPADAATLFSQPSVQHIVAIALAFILKGKKRTAPPAQ